MSKIKFNPFLEQLTGSFGQIVFRRYGDRMIIAHKPDLHGVEATPGQVAQRERFRQAVLYAQRTLADPVAAQPYQNAAQRGDKPLFALTMTDYLVAPTVSEIDLSAYNGKTGDAIVIQARDDFEVSGVQVRLQGAAGALLESGPAQENPPGTGRWVYAAQSQAAPGSTVHVTASATDRPGSIAELSVDKAL